MNRRAGARGTQHQSGVRILPAAHCRDRVLVAQTGRHDPHDLLRRLLEAPLARDGGEVPEVEADAGKPSLEVEAELAERPVELTEAEVEHLQGLGLATETIKHMRDAVQPVVEPEA